MKCIIKPYQPCDAQKVAQVFTQAVHTIDSHYYTEAQKSAWANPSFDLTQWEKRLFKTQPWCAWKGGATCRLYRA